MRRPLKPFVTEYKANNRRPKEASRAFGMEAEAPHEHEAREATADQQKIARSKTKSFGSRSADPPASAMRNAKGKADRRGDMPRETAWANDTARFTGAQSDDSYEAAMRAADALFSGAPTRSHTAPDGDPSMDDVFAKPPAEAPAPNGGRILRAIDEAPDTALAEIEAERAPKRRGRKPGSKNKPKAPVSLPSDMPALFSHQSPQHGAADDPDDDDDHALANGTLLDDVTMDHVAMDHATNSEAAPFPSTGSNSMPPSPALQALPAVGTRGDRRFAWVRTKLGPGEQWKRRLPKIIW